MAGDIEPVNSGWLNKTNKLPVRQRLLPEIFLKLEAFDGQLPGLVGRSIKIRKFPICHFLHYPEGAFYRVRNLDDQKPELSDEFQFGSGLGKEKLFFVKFLFA
jgi:hypothetical protein